YTAERRGARATIGAGKARSAPAVAFVERLDHQLGHNPWQRVELTLEAAEPALHLAHAALNVGDIAGKLGALTAGQPEFQLDKVGDVLHVLFTGTDALFQSRHVTLQRRYSLLEISHRRAPMIASHYFQRI